jgi:epoxyqueuosine reductase QueG
MILKEFEEYANSLNIFKVAYTNIKTKNNLKIKFNNVIVLAIEMDMEILESKPGEKAKNLNNAFYEKFRKITEELTKYLLNNGIESQIAYPNEQLINLPFLGEKSGIGGIGKNGILITPEFGLRVKLSGILTSFEDPSFEFSEKNING